MPKKTKRKKSADTLTATLSKKAKKSIYTVGDLRKVYKRGTAAYMSSGSRNVTVGAWSMGRVNSFISGGGARKADIDIHNARKKSPKKR